MPKMTLKEAQEVLDKYNNQIPTLFQGLLECSRDWQAWTYKTMQEDDFHPAEENDTTIAEAEIFIEKLLEAARVVERERAFTILHEAAMRTENLQSLGLIEKLQFEILSDNQEEK